VKSCARRVTGTAGWASAAFPVLEADAHFQPPRIETREVLGLRLTQPSDDVPLGRATLGREATGGPAPAAALDDLLLGLIVLRYTQSNSVAYLKDGMALGIGAGQQSRIDCTQDAGAKRGSGCFGIEPVSCQIPWNRDLRGRKASARSPS
jgi:AICAR transformylase/IMP cyclohydrolase PurH